MAARSWPSTNWSRNEAIAAVITSSRIAALTWSGHLRALCGFLVLLGQT
jgi:hypothetical protein